MLISNFLEIFKQSPFKGPFTKTNCKEIYKLSTTKTNHERYSCEFGSKKYFALCGLGGMISCGLTHTFIVPVDLVKCRLQTDPEKYKNFMHGTRLTIDEEGILGLTKGWAPTLLGYSAQGCLKFGLYEVFKVYYGKFLEKEKTYWYRTWLYLAASASAEFFADIALCPFETVKVKMQTMPDFANTFREAVQKMLNDEGISAFYRGLIPLWCRQVPYTMMKFASFERTIELLYNHIVPKSRSQCTKNEQLLITFAAGYIAGIFCAVISHPADVFVSKLNQNKELSVLQIANNLGFFGIWKGLTTRILMVGTLTALQWFIYDGVKVILKIPQAPPVELPKTSKNR